MNLLMPQSPDPTPALAAKAATLGWQTGLVVQSQLFTGDGELKYREFSAALAASPATWIALDIENPQWLDLFNTNPKLYIDEVLHVVRMIHAENKRVVVYNEFTFGSSWLVCKDFLRAVDAFSLNCYFDFPWEMDPDQPFPGVRWWDIMHTRQDYQREIATLYRKPLMVWVQPFTSQINVDAPRRLRVPAAVMAELAEQTKTCKYFAYWAASSYFAREGMLDISPAEIDSDYESHLEAITKGRA